MTMLRYNGGKAPLSLIPSSFFEAIVSRSMDYSTPVPTKLIFAVGAVLDFGAQKYAAHNWRKGGPWSSVLNSGLRHLVAMMDGSRIDFESNLTEAGHLGCNLAFLLEFAYQGIGEDDRHVTDLRIDFDAVPEPSLIWVLDALLKFRDGGDLDYLKDAIWELARWYELQSFDEAAPAAPPAPENHTPEGEEVRILWFMRPQAPAQPKPQVFIDPVELPKRMYRKFPFAFPSFAHIAPQGETRH